jgi:penicillin-binding protein 1A
VASNSVERSQSLTGSIVKGTLKAVGGTLLGIIMIGGAAVICPM